ncbi:MAG: FtsX-like permease family protein [Peptostreptococcaceae bacterium]|nr:FtsX-like permease family protein [Peptostreptococcaceae bacterium]
MNLYTSLTLRYLKENKKRTIVTIIGIILSTALICGIGNIYESFMDYQIRKTIENDGDFHATFYDIKKDDLDYITKSAGLTKSGLSNNLGYAKIKPDKENLMQVKAYDKTTFDGYQIKLKEGKLPTNNKEIVLSENIVSKIDKKIGDTITLDIGKRVDENGEEISGWQSENETLKDTKSESFKIVGIINKPGFEYEGGILTGITYLDINNQPANDSFNVSIAVKKPKEVYTIASQISKNLGLKSGTKEEGNEESAEENSSMHYSSDTDEFYESLSFNEHLLRLQGASAYANINDSMTSIIALVTTLVIVCTIATVYNSFSISISERKKQFGILNSIGATKSQVMKLVFIEGILVSIVAIPIGLISGTIAIDLVFKVIQAFFKTSFIADMNLRVVYNPAIMILSTVIVLITILISALLPAISAAKTSPLEAIKNSGNYKLGKIKDSKLVRLLFKTEGVLAYKNLRRNKKKFRTTLFSLIISIVIFISFSGFMTLFLKANTVHMGQINHDIYMYKNGSSEDIKIIDELKNINGIKNIAINNDYGIGLNVKENDINTTYKDLIDNYYTKEKVGNEYSYDFISSLVKMPGDIAINNLKLKDGSFDKETAIKENGVILVRESYYEEKGKKGEVVLTNYKVGDTIDAYITNYDQDTDKEIKENIKLKVMAITDDLIPGSYNYNYMGIDFITYDEVGEKLGFKPLNGSIYMSTDKEDNTRKEIKEIADKEGFKVIDEIEEAKAMEQSIMAMQVFVYGFITVISLVSVTNIVNTISTNINLRKRELAIIKSIGVTPGGFNKMICLEGLLYGILSLLYGLPIGIGMVVLMNTLLGDVIQFGLVLPWSGIIICIVGIFVITFIASYIPMKKINKENIIENIRQESI